MAYYEKETAFSSYIEFRKDPDVVSHYGQVSAQTLKTAMRAKIDLDLSSVSDELLSQALTASNYYVPHEFQGDAVLEFIVADFLIQNELNGKFFSESALKSLKSNHALEKTAKNIRKHSSEKRHKAISLGKYVIYFDPSKNLNGAPPIDDVMEGILGATYRGTGYLSARKVFATLFQLGYPKLRRFEINPDEYLFRINEKHRNVLMRCFLKIYLRQFEDLPEVCKIVGYRKDDTSFSRFYFNFPNRPIKKAFLGDFIASAVRQVNLDNLFSRIGKLGFEKSWAILDQKIHSEVQKHLRFPNSRRESASYSIFLNGVESAASSVLDKVLQALE